MLLLDDNTLAQGFLTRTYALMSIFFTMQWSSLEYFSVRTIPEIYWGRIGRKNSHGLRGDLGDCGGYRKLGVIILTSCSALSACLAEVSIRVLHLSNSLVCDLLN